MKFLLITSVLISSLTANATEVDAKVHNDILIKTPKSMPSLYLKRSVNSQRMSLSNDDYTPNDPWFKYQSQWNESTIEKPSSNNILNSVRGLSPLRRGTIGVIDSGFYEHPDVSYFDGYNMVSRSEREKGEYFYVSEEFNTDPDTRRANCGVHGTGVAGVSSATRDNNLGMAGISDANLIAVRAMNCGSGYLSDAANSLAWLSGTQVDDIRPPKEKADVVNLSLGALASDCPNYIQEPVTSAINNDTLVVAAAGNDSIDASGFTPANCTGVITVASAGEDGHILPSSNFGMMIDIAALGENVTSFTSDEDVVGWWAGTSFAAPTVSGVLMNAVQEFGDVSVTEAKFFMSATATPFISGICDDSTHCGPGILDAEAFHSALRMYKSGNMVTLRPALGNTEFCDKTLYATTDDELARLCSLNEITLPHYQGSRKDIRYEVLAYDKEEEISNDSGELVLTLYNEKSLVSSLDMSLFNYGIRMCDNDRCFGDQPLPIKNALSEIPAICKE